MSAKEPSPPEVPNGVAEGEKTHEDASPTQGNDGVPETHAVVAAEKANGNGNGQDHSDASHDQGARHDHHDHEMEQESDDESDDEEEEPALKYERLGGGAQEILEKDTASSLAVSTRLMALGTHNGIVHVLDFNGTRIKSYRPHSASINNIRIDDNGEFIATASVDGKVVIHSLLTPETYTFDFRRPMRTFSFEPSFSKRSTRAFVCGGLAGNLEMHEKGWLGHKETTIHSGEGPIWTTAWRSNLIAWANDLGVKIYDTNSQQRISYIDREADSPRADLFKCTLRWRDDSNLLIAWADHIKLVNMRPRVTANANALPYQVEITAIFQVDCMISGLAPYPSPPGSFLVLAYLPPDTFTNEATSDPAEQRRKAANPPELRIISHSGEELSSDVLQLNGYEFFGCNDYVLQPAFTTSIEDGFYVVVSPKNIVLVRKRDESDHVQWLVENKRYEEALSEVERIGGNKFDAPVIGKKYLEHLVADGDFEKAAKLCPTVLKQDARAWEDWIFVFVREKHLQTVIPYIPTKDPQLTRLIYEMILAHFLGHDRDMLLHTIKEWPSGIYDIAAVIVAVKSELDRSSTSNILMECLAELYLLNRQPTLALPYFIRLRRPNVFDLIRDNNLFTSVQDQALLLVEFDQELEEKRKQEKGPNGEAPQELKDGKKERSKAIALLVEHTHSIPIARVVQQLQERPYYLYLYLDALFDEDALLASDFADQQVLLYAEYAPKRLMDFLRASNYYSLEQAYAVCKEKDMVPEMVFLLGRMGNNKEALNLIIERLGDVNRAIDFAKEQNDDDLWEDLLKYSETKPAFIRGLLENVGAEINPIRLIRRIKDGLEVPGLKDALIKILWEFNLQISLLEGTQTILHGDTTDLATRLQSSQTSGFFGTSSSTCPICGLPLFLPLPLPAPGSQQLVLLFLCRHMVHASCVKGGDDLPPHPDDTVLSLLGGNNPGSGSWFRDSVGGKIAYTATVRACLQEGCPVCHMNEDGLTLDAR